MHNACNHNHCKFSLACILQSQVVEVLVNKEVDLSVNLVSEGMQIP